MSSRRFIIGIDLGTTNTAVAFVDTQAADQRVTVFEVPQLIAPGELAPRRQLPSFVYLPTEHDLGPSETALPWDRARRRVVGELARAQGARVASRMVASAKSWLCHAGVDRNARILPWGVDQADNAERISPVEASASVLTHVREAWDHVHGGSAPFAQQEIIVTVPASFDEAARELTVAAAERAQYPAVVLLEEPQAAFYAWIDSHPGSSRQLAPGERVLVFDIGGGTTDFTLISVADAADGDAFERTAVGDHLLLGGDNIDLTLAKLVEARLTSGGSKKLDPLQWHGLVHTCRLAKEALLEDEALDRVPVAVAGRGSKLIGGTLKSEITRDELTRTIFDGFFPLVARDAMPQRLRGGLQEYGLPYASDPAVPRHLASFLERHGAQSVDAVLFNGGAMTPAALRQRVIDQLGAWQDAAPRELANELPELAVAKGAAYYGLVRRGLGARIRGGTPRTFSVGVGRQAGDEKAVCLAPKGLEDGAVIELDRDFELVTNRPVSFKLFSSSTRADAPGEIVEVGDGLPDMADDDSDLLELPPIVTVLRARGRAQVRVHLQVRITELGALEIWCRETQPSEEPGVETEWRLSFDMRSGGAAATGEPTGGEAAPRTPAARALIETVFTGGKSAELSGVMKGLERVLEVRRDEWATATARALFDAAFEVEEHRKKSPDHEARWLTLTGFCLRPGTGAPLDQWRAKQMWRVFNDGLTYERKSEACRLAWWIAWRRVAGGLSTGQQEQIFDRLGQLFIPGPKQKKKWHSVKPTKQEAAEMLRCLANLERLEQTSKIKLGDELMRRLAEKDSDPLYFWALGRIGSRVPLYGPLNCCVPAQRVNEWVSSLVELDWGAEPEKASFPMAQLGRRTGDRSRDLDPELRQRLATRLRELPGGDRTAKLVEEIVALEAREERVALGDTLPAGLRLVADDA
ncbi:MAG TPA: Hsp70 family protein [Kofleriaceae bacterium]|nr:Hsp70 family protein [Kofleriaceae bacterium]